MVFLIRDGAYRSIRNGLRRRGWVEQDYANRRGNPFSGPKRTPVKTERGCVTQVGVVSDDSDYDDENDPFQDEEEVHSDEEEYRMIVSRCLFTCSVMYEAREGGYASWALFIIPPKLIEIYTNLHYACALIGVLFYLRIMAGAMYL